MAAKPTKVVATDGTELHVVTHRGEPAPGPQVVLLHGLACVGAMWDGVVGALSSSHLVVVPDLRGHGSSGPVPGGTAAFDLAQQADDVRSVLEALDLRDVVLVGHSGGGYATLELAARHPEVVRARVRRIITVGTAGTLLHARERAVLRFSASRLFYAMLRLPFLGRQVVRSAAFGGAPRPEWVEATRAMALACPRSTKAAWVRAISGTTVQDRLSTALATPVTVTAGSLDAAVTETRARELATACGDHGTVVILDGAGHMAPIEQPEAIAEFVVRSFSD